MSALEILTHPTATFCESCGRKPGRYRVMICGHPLRGERSYGRNDPFVLCIACKREWREAWDSALDSKPKAAAS